MRAVIYCRVSADHRHGRSVAEQEAECRSECTRRGWDIVEVLTDNDRSASRHARKTRPAWDRTRQLVAGGEVDVLVTWEASRAQRDLDAYAELRRTCAAAGVRWAYGGGVYDMTERSDRFRTGLDALVAEDEADRTRERVLRALRSNARHGRPHGRCPYGYRRVYDPQTGLSHQEVDPTEAMVIHEAASRFLAGESTRSIANDFAARRIPTMRGGRWDLNTVRRLLTNPAYNGKRTHLGTVVGDAAWPAILDDDTFGQLAARFADPSRSTMRRSPNVHLLAGVLRCGVCAGPMTWARSRGAPVYACRHGQHVARAVHHLERHVTDVIVTRLSAPDARATLADAEPPIAASEALAEAAALRAQLDDAYSAFRAGDLSATLLGRAEADLAPKVADAERRARVVGLPTVAADLASSDNVAATWEALTLEQRREIVRALVDVVVHPARQRGPGYDPSSIDITWKRDS
jgi:DNA invertase Pin-like site-specific DNA recombinase